MNSGVEIVLARMSTHPEEFYGDSDKWKFIYKEYFRDAMSEEEKGAIFDRIKEIRKEEFTQAVMRTMLTDNREDREEVWEKEAGYAVPHKKGGKVLYTKTMTPNGTEVTEDSMGRIFLNGVLVK